MTPEIMMEQITSSSKCREVFEWRKWGNEIPQLTFPGNWLIRIVPPFRGAIVRFRVATKENPKLEISVYLDCYNMLGSFGEPNEPYWEIYPYEYDTWRCAMHETDKLIEHIELGLQQLIMEKDKENMKYRRKSLEVEAIQYTIENIIEIKNFIERVDKRYKILPTFSALSLVIDVLKEDTLKINLNDYIVKDVGDEKLYSYTKEIFENLFEKIDKKKVSDFDVEC